MILPGRLRHTTLGDLLGALHRARASGTLELVDDRGRSHRIALSEGCVVAVDVDGMAPSLAEVLRREGLVRDDVLRRTLERALAARRLHGEVLTEVAAITESALEAALRKQLGLRLDALEALRDARISFRVAQRPPSRRVGPLDAPEFLHGRPRARDRSPAPPSYGRYGASSEDAPSQDAPSPEASGEFASASWAEARTSPRGAPPRRAEPVTSAPRGAWHVLGLRQGASSGEIRRAYRTLARRFHPDAHPRASEAERRELAQRFAELTAAYRTLVA